MKKKDLSTVTAKQIIKKAKEKESVSTLKQRNNEVSEPRPDIRTLITEWGLRPEAIKGVLLKELNIWFHC